MKMERQRNMAGKINLTMIKENMVINLTAVEGIILGKNLTEVEEDLTVGEESQPTKKAVDEVSITILLINLKIRALGTVIENHHLKDSAV